ncbi:MAG: hypothetical protein V8R91_12165 [Butyricimonas faecihominis]
MYKVLVADDGATKDGAGFAGLFLFCLELIYGGSQGICVERVFCQKVEVIHGVYQGIRTAELYLNRAEAYTQKFMTEGNDAYRNQA